MNEPVIDGPSVSVKRAACGQESEELYFPDNSQCDKLIESSLSLYVLTKRVAYLAAFVDYIRCKVKNREFVPPRLNTYDLDMALNRIVGFVQRKYYDQTLSLMRSDSSESLTEAIEKCGQQNSGQPKKWLNELRALNRFRPCVDNEGLVRVEAIRLSNSPELTEDMKHPLILSSECVLTRLVVLQYHVDSSHVGVQQTLLTTRKKFLIINGNAAVKRYLSQCGRCSLDKVKPVRQLMADLPVERTTAGHLRLLRCAVCGLDCFGQVNCVEGRSTKKAWGLLFTCMSSRSVHVEVFTSLLLKDFLLAFSRFNDVRGKVEVIFSDNGSSFQAASKALPHLLKSTELWNSLRGKRHTMGVHALIRPGTGWNLGVDGKTG